MRVHLTKWFLGTCVLLLGMYLFLLIPDHIAAVSSEPRQEPFAWNRDAYWSALESRFRTARAAGCTELSLAIEQRLSRADSLNAILLSESFPPAASAFDEAETNFFDLAVLIAACPTRFGDYMKIFGELRRALKQQSAHWDMNSPDGRDRIYKLLYGGRIAIEEVILQSTDGLSSGEVAESKYPSAIPSTTILGVEIHSGDILVSRGGAPTSALIARGSDYPGNFSHVALVYVAEETKQVSIIESHIEKGVALANVTGYLKDTKLRVLVLRLRSDLPQLKTDPLLPHKAAKFMFEYACSKHIPYDFAMDTQDDSKMFCSEVAAYAYGHLGIQLWAGLSHLSGAGVRNWLSAFGVRNFTTKEPSDLEYDPQLSVVAEWRDFETLYKDHLDNAVVDIMLESADSGATLGYDWYMLPVARALKAYSAVLNLFGEIGPVPEGMTATAALKNKWFSERHRDAVERLRVLANDFRQQNGYTPLYWELIRLARKVYAPSVSR